MLASLLVALVIFNDSAEPPTYVIAMTGCAIWYLSEPVRSRTDHIVTLAIMLGVSLISTDLYPRAGRTLIGPYTAKAVGCLILWLRMNWELLTKCAERLGGAQKQALEEACELAEEQEDEHLYHSRGYCRELWLDSLGLPAMLPPPEEMQHVRSAISAAQAQQQSERNR